MKETVTLQMTLITIYNSCVWNNTICLAILPRLAGWLTFPICHVEVAKSQSVQGLFGYWGIMPSCQMGLSEFYFFWSVKTSAPKDQTAPDFYFFSPLAAYAFLSFSFLPSFLLSLSLSLFVCFSFLYLIAL